MHLQLSVVILAAGQGTRMKSELPKVLHRVGHLTLVEHVIATAQDLEASQIVVVYGHGGEQVPKTLAHLNVNWVLQAEQLGTGHAVDQAMPHISDAQTVLVLYGDVPLITSQTLENLVTLASESSMGLLTANLPDPTGYGRIIRDNTGTVMYIVEQKDANSDQLKITEINTGMLAVNAKLLRGWLQQLDNDNAQGEFYLTDIIEKAVQDEIKVKTIHPQELVEIEGINNKKQLAEVERAYQLRIAERLMLDGVTLRDPSRLDVRGELITGTDVSIDANVVIEGRVTLGNNVLIEANNVIIDSTIGDNTIVHANCVIEKSHIGNHCEIGPFARVRPQTQLSENAKIGNFVEIKKSQIGENSKVNHLSYIGDTIMGKYVNVGAGTITCNYDGANKYQTVIGDKAFIGSDTQLVAPVEIGAGATIGAGSTITHDAPANELTLSRSEQKTRKGWKRPTKNK